MLAIACRHIIISGTVWPPLPITSLRIAAISQWHSFVLGKYTIDVMLRRNSDGEYPIVYGRGGGQDSYFDYVREWREMHPDVSWKQAVKMAREDYHGGMSLATPHVHNLGPAIITRARPQGFGGNAVPIQSLPPPPSAEEYRRLALLANTRRDDRSQLGPRGI